MNAADYYAEAKENWRILLLTAMLLVSALAIAPGPQTDNATNLQFGLQLSGGTQVRAPLEGKMVTGLDYSDGPDPTAVESNASSALELPLSDVEARPGAGAFEVYDENVSDEAIASALQASGFDVQADDVEEGLTEATYDEAQSVVRTKLSESTQFSGGRVTIQQTPTGDKFLKVEVPGAERDEVLDLLNERGVVRVVAVYPATENGTTVSRNATVLNQDDLDPGAVRESDRGESFVPVTLTEDARDRFSEDMRQYGFAQQGGVTCLFDENPQAPGHCLVVYKDGEYVNSFGMAPTLSQPIREGTFGGSFRMTTGTGPNATESAQDVRIALQAGALPSDLQVDEGDNRFIEPQYAQEFKRFSLITGIVSAIAVAIVVFVRYREPRVAAPMVATALAEVFVLLGFAASIGLALDLSHIAGFIAVIGTGVDDLVIIADEVLNQGDVRTRRVFQSRFRKAFWVIGVAAITTIIAMAPLTVLSLGDLTGFALVTIVGVLIGVLVTRPAYGDILRALMTRQQD
jgi:preprotein translocase subunit SecD